MSKLQTNPFDVYEKYLIESLKDKMIKNIAQKIADEIKPQVEEVVNKMHIEYKMFKDHYSMEQNIHLYCNFNGEEIVNKKVKGR